MLSNDLGASNIRFKLLSITKVVAQWFDYDWWVKSRNFLGVVEIGYVL